MPQANPRPDSELLSLAQVQPLIQALYDSLPDVRYYALKTLIQLPLSGEAWLWLSAFLGEKLKEPGYRDDYAGDDPYFYISAAGYIPTSSMRKRLRQLMQDGNEYERLEAACALAQRGDSQSIPFLLNVLLTSYEEARQKAAEALSFLDLSEHKEKIRQAFEGEEQPETRLYLALGLARQGDLSALQAFFQHAPGSLRDPLHTPGGLAWEMHLRGPYPGEALQVFRAAAQNEQLKPAIRQAAALLLAGEQAKQVDQESPLSEDLLIEMEVYANDSANQLVQSFPSLGAVQQFTEHANSLRYLRPQSASRLVSGLFRRLAGKTHEYWLGDLVVLLVHNLERPFEPESEQLLQVYRTLDPQSPLAWQVLWAASHARPAALLESTAELLTSPEVAGRQAAARFLYYTSCYAQHATPPLAAGLQMEDTRREAFPAIKNTLVAALQNTFKGFVDNVYETIQGHDVLESQIALDEAWEFVSTKAPGSMRLQPAQISAPGHAAPASRELTPTAAAPGAPGTLSSEDSFEAYPHLDAPTMVQAQQEFSVEVGFRQERDANLLQGEQIVIEAPLAGVPMMVLLVSDQVEVLDGFHRTLPLKLDARAVFRCRAKAGVSYAELSVHYIYNGQTVGIATRPLVVMPAAAPGPAVTAQPQAAAVQETPPAPTGEPAAVTPELPKTAERESRCRLGLNAEGTPPDLEVTIKKGSDGRLLWSFLAKELHTPPVEITLQEAREFAGKLIKDLRTQGFAGELAANILENIGQDIADVMPPEFFDAVSLLNKRLGRPPVVLLLTDESYVPWELAVMEEPLDPALPPFVGVQMPVSRWYYHDKVVQPPPAEAAIEHISAVASEYGLGTDLSELEQARVEQEFLALNFGAQKVEAKQADLEQLIKSGHSGHLVHFSVHGLSDPEANDEALLLADKKKLTPSALTGRYRCGDPPRFTFIFLNACQVGTAGTSLGQVAGFPGDLIRGGTLGFLAPLWEVHDVEARQMAEAFYDTVLTEGMPVSEFLYKQRQGYQRAGSTTPLAYLFYGHPGLRLKKTDT